VEHFSKLNYDQPNKEAVTIVISMWLLVTVVDRASGYVRKRLLGSELQRN